MQSRMNHAGGAVLILFLALLLAGCGADQAASMPATPSGLQPANAGGRPTAMAVAATRPPDTASDPAQATPVALATATNPAGPAAGPSGNGIDMSKVEACKLLSQAEIEAVMGPITYDPHAYPSTSGEQKQCIYVASVVAGEAQVAGQGLDLVVWPTSDWEMLKTGRSGTVSGIGDEAVSADLGPTGLALWVLFRDKAVVNVQVFPKDLEIAKQLALKVVAHLP